MKRKADGDLEKQNRTLREWNCEMCDKSFEKEVTLRKHEQTMTHKRKMSAMNNDEKSAFTCELCMEDFFNQKSFVKHIENDQHKRYLKEKIEFPDIADARHKYLVAARQKCHYCYSIIQISSLRSHVKGVTHIKKMQKAFNDGLPFRYYDFNNIKDCTILNMHPIVSEKKFRLPTSIVGFIASFLDSNDIVFNNTMHWDMHFSWYDEIVQKKPDLMSYAFRNKVIPTSWFFQHKNLLKKSPFKLDKKEYKTIAGLRHHSRLFEMHPELISPELLQNSAWYAQSSFPNLQMLYEFYSNPLKLSQETRAHVRQLDDDLRKLINAQMKINQEQSVAQVQEHIQDDSYIVQYAPMHLGPPSLENANYLKCDLRDPDVLKSINIEALQTHERKHLFANKSIYFAFLNQSIACIEWSELLKNPYAPIDFLLQHKKLILQISHEHDDVACALLQSTVIANYQLQAAYLITLFC